MFFAEFDSLKLDSMCPLKSPDAEVKKLVVLIWKLFIHYYQLFNGQTQDLTFLIRKKSELSLGSFVFFQCKVTGVFLVQDHVSNDINDPESCANRHINIFDVLVSG